MEPRVCAATAQPLYRPPPNNNCGELQGPTAASLDAETSRYGEAIRSSLPGQNGRHERSVDGQMFGLIACSICLRVRRGSEWLDAEHVIRDIKSYDGELPRLKSAVCDECADAIFRRRAEWEDALAA